MPRIISENQWLIAIDKPAGLIAHSDGRTVENSLAQWIAEKYPEMIGVGGAWISPQGETINLNGLVHRLDRTTSGVVLAAKTDEAFEYLRNEFRARRVGKKYLAWVYGKIEASDGTIIAEIMRSNPPDGGAKRWYARACEQDHPRAAITDWRILKTTDTASLLEISPRTGRTHQIRVHMAHIGHPIVADHLYAPEGETILGFQRPALHAVSVSLTLPDGEKVTYSANLPKDFQNISDTLQS